VKFGHHRGQSRALVRDGDRVSSLTCWRMLLKCSRRNGRRGGMSESPHGRKPSAFSRWLRTGRLPPAVSPDGLELKFNPWHDPTDGRFTFAGAGRHYGTGEADTASGASSRTSARAGATPASVGRSKSQTATRSKPETSRTRPPASDAHRAVRPMSSPVQPRGIGGGRPGNEPNPVTEFVGGVGEGLHEVGRETVAEVALR